MRIFLLLFALLPAVATAATSPYAGWESRPIKALSAKQIDDLQQGRGMSLALPAELNGYPGPKHILELSDPLRLSADQRRLVEEAFTRMQREARETGQQVLNAEKTLEKLFANRAASSPSLTAAANAAGERWAALRRVHLKYHIEMVDVLSVEQLRLYREHRGYAAPSAHGGHDH